MNKAFQSYLTSLKYQLQILDKNESMFLQRCAYTNNKHTIQKIRLESAFSYSESILELSEQQRINKLEKSPKYFKGRKFGRG